MEIYKFYYDKRSSTEIAKKKKQDWHYRVFLQENILDTILSLSKLYFRRYNEYNNKYLDIYINK